jgi:AcrR family transcriptional regulator
MSERNQNNIATDHPSLGPGHDAVATRDRILEAAGEVFAERGYRDATVREICARAGANLASINYHFGDKERLYAEVFDRARCASHEAMERLAELAGHPAEDRLAAFVNAFLSKLLDRGRPTWHAKLMSREMIDPTAVLERMIEQSIRPQWEMLCGVVAELLGVPARSHAASMAAASVMGQCLHYHHTREVGARLCPGFYDRERIIAEVAQHVTTFSLCAMQGMRDRIERGEVPREWIVEVLP